MAESFFDKISRNSTHTPDVLACLANLSNDEVFTPPEVVSQMLDMLPQELFQSRETTFLDPACKTGVFLREIAKRLLHYQMPLYQEKMALISEKKTLKIPMSVEDEIFIDRLQAAVDHICHNQLFGIAITELTSLLSRRSVYCSKYPNGRYSISEFDDSEGNIRFRRIEHTWDRSDEKGKCVFCGASYKTWERGKELETHAYEWIHTNSPERIFNMKFDVIISNPPYQLSDGGAQASASPIYNKFVEQAKKLNPRYITMIIPSRWMTGGKGLDSFRKEMINDTHIRELHDFADSKMCFNGVDIKGGVCFFLRDISYDGDCTCIRHDVNGSSSSVRPLCENGLDIFIREPMLVQINNKVRSFGEQSIADIVSSRKPYAIVAEAMRNPQKFGLPKFSDTEIDGGYRILGLGEKQKRCWKYLPKDYPIPKRDEGLMKYKVFIAEAYGCGEIGEVPSTPVLSTPVLSTPGELCTETFLQIGPFETEHEAANLLSYIRTKFFRMLVGIKKQTQHTTKKVYEFVPIQDFSKPWTDEELYAKYGLTEEEIAFIESMIKPMED